MTNKKNNNIGYFVPDHGGTIKDTLYFQQESDDDLEDYACAAAEYAWSNNDGWEWLRTGTKLTIVKDQEILGTCEITVDYEPLFYAEKSKDN